MTLAIPTLPLVFWPSTLRAHSPTTDFGLGCVFSSFKTTMRVKESSSIFSGAGDKATELTHSLLKRQLRRYLGNLDSFPQEWLNFVGAVNNAYLEFDDDRRMLERSLELTSQELLNTNKNAEDRFRKAFDANPEPIAIATIPEGCYE